MKSSTIKLYTHEQPNRNCTHANAWAIGERVTRWSWYNVLHWFRPPTLEGVVIQPNDPPQIDDSEEFTSAMFAKGGFLEDALLNHYLKLTVPGLPTPLMINAAFLINNYLWGNDQGVAVLKRLIDRAKETYWSYNTSTTVTTTDV